MKTDKLFAYIALWALLLQGLLVLASWFVTAAYPELEMRSLFEGGGIRWYVGQFVDNLTSPVLVWLLLLSLALGAAMRSGLCSALRHMSNHDYRQKLALRLVVFELVVFVSIMLALTMAPHAVLLNVTGHIYPSSFSSGIVPLLALAVIVLSVTFGLSVGNQRSVIDVFDMLTYGVRVAAPLYVDYVLLASLYHSVCFVFML